jgi:hypothetical protein
MTEAERVEEMRERIASSAFANAHGVEVKAGVKVPYGFEITTYGSHPESSTITFEAVEERGSPSS